MSGKVHYEGDLDIRERRGGAWTTQIRLIRTKGRGLAVCIAPYGADTTANLANVTCLRCKRLVELHMRTAAEAPLAGAQDERRGFLYGFNAACKLHGKSYDCATAEDAYQALYGKRTPKGAGVAGDEA